MELCYYLTQKGSPDKKNLKPGEQLKLKRSAKELFNNNHLKLPNHFSVMYGYETDIKFKLYISDELINKYKDLPEIQNVLIDLADSKRCVYFSANKSLDDKRDFVYGKDNNGNTVRISAQIKEDIDLDKRLNNSEDIYNSILEKYGISLRCKYLQLLFDNYTINAFRHIFLNTYISVMTGTTIDKKTAESFVIDVDTKNNTITLKDINLTEPSSEMMSRFYRSRYSGGLNLMAESKSEKEVKNFYLDGAKSEWLKYDKNSFKTIVPNTNTPGVYMLYDSEKKHFYVGKANDLQGRILQHRTEGDPIPEFDYYRFSVTDEKWINELYLIENAAIHDAAMIFNMPKGPNYNGMALNMNNLFKNVGFGEIVLVNTQETQTKDNTNKKNNK